MKLLHQQFEKNMEGSLKVVPEEGGSFSSASIDTLLLSLFNLMNTSNM